ncbi:histone-lysine N-methyltransferase SETMAR-like [Babylonia areolata]|uniref:histone-lysine N-methyltransferase SETMAR-like n=1 Tax=Babylonia areolata TaxID=304850 RepID=UPI003FD2D047
MEPVECRAVIRFLYLRGLTQRETLEEMKETWEGCPIVCCGQALHRQFKRGRTSLETAPNPRRPQSATDEDTVWQVETAILEDRLITVRPPAQDVKIGVIFVEKNHPRPFAHAEVGCMMDFPVAHTFPEAGTSRVLQGSFGHMPRKPGDFFDRQITQDETCIHHYDPETKAQSKQWNHFDSPPPKKARVQLSAAKVMLTVFWDQSGVVMMGFLTKGTTITWTCNDSFLQKLRQSSKPERRGMLTKGVRLLQDNALVHNSHVAQVEARSCSYEILLHPLTTLPTSHHQTSTSFHPRSHF